MADKPRKVTGRGRPRVEAPRRVKLDLRITADLYAAIQKQADAERRSASAVARNALEDAFLRKKAPN